MTREFFNDVLSLIETLASQLHAEISLNALEVEDFIQQTLAGSTQSLQSKVLDMVMDCASFLDNTSGECFSVCCLPFWPELLFLSLSLEFFTSHFLFYVCYVSHC